MEAAAEASGGGVIHGDPTRAELEVEETTLGATAKDRTAALAEATAKVGQAPAHPNMANLAVVVDRVEVGGPQSTAPVEAVVMEGEREEDAEATMAVAEEEGVDTLTR